MRFGAAYYPEHWPQERWPLDARMMQEAGFNIVRLAEFAWTRMEPREGEFHFEWLDKSLGLLSEHGIDAMLCTPTAVPPNWAVYDALEILPVRQEGTITGPGARRHYCPTQPRYREHTARIVRAMGEHYAQHPSVVAWQIDNEFTGNIGGGYCYCECCEQRFQQWLEAQYGTLDALNAAWGNEFWSQLYTDWREIAPPRLMGAIPNPSHVLAWRRFYTDIWTEYYTLQRDILRECGVAVPITTNLMGVYSNAIDLYTHAQAMDFIAWDNYPCGYPNQAGNWSSALANDYMRSLKPGKTYWVTEQQSGGGGQGAIFARTAPGYMRLMTYQSLAHGAEGLLYFRWRTARFGAEQYWHGILQHDGRPNWRYAEVQQTGTELRALPEDLFTAGVSAQVAILFSPDQQWAHEIQSHVNGFTYQGEAQAAYNALREAGVEVDMVNEESDFSQYKVLLAPAWQLVPADTAEQIIEFVRSGGLLVTTFRTAVKDWESVIFEDPTPGPLRELLGITVDDYDPLGAQDATVGVRLTGEAPLAGTVTGTLWADVITAEEAEVAGIFSGGWYAGRPAITVNRFGLGEAWYIGTHLDGAFWKPFVDYLLAASEIPTAPATSEGVEIAHRQGERHYTFVLNMQQGGGWVELDTAQTDLLTGEEVGPGIVSLPGYGVRILV